MNDKNEYDILVLSPHLDDAVLSLGSHIIKWKKEGKKIKVITVFNRFGNEENIPSYSKNYLRKSGFDTIAEFEDARNREDRRAMKMMGVDYENWGFVDAGFRGIYGTRGKLLSGVIDKRDKVLIKRIEEKIKKLKSDLLLVPFGVGGHVDHLIVKKVAEEMRININYYLESPYLWQNFNYIKLIWKIFRIKSVIREKNEKQRILRSYKSQYNLLMDKDKNFIEVII